MEPNVLSNPNSIVTVILVIIVVIVAIKIFKKIMKVLFFFLVIIGIIIALFVTGILDYQKVLHKLIGEKSTSIQTPIKKDHKNEIDFKEFNCS